MKITHLVPMISLATVVAACGGQQTSSNDASMANVQAEVDQNVIKAHVDFLADDLLKGRDTGSEGFEIAANYVEAHFKQYGLLPGGDDGTYKQRVTFRQTYLNLDSPEFTIHGADGDVSLQHPKEHMMSGSSLNAESAVTADLVFVGHGIEAPSLNHNDYEGLDVKGKIVVMVGGFPKDFPGEEGAHLASNSQKSKYAAERGAVGTITIATPKSEKNRPYKRYMMYIKNARYTWVGEDGIPNGVRPEIKNSSYVNHEAAKKLFVNAPTPLENIWDDLENDRAPKGFDMGISVTLKKTSRHVNTTSPNVAAILEGSDPNLKNEYVVFSAHLDATGVAKTLDEDRIKNGAMDNAIGSATLIEMARIFSSMEKRPKRSIMFLAVTAEEKGLLGASYFSKFPTIPKQQIVANVNLDMPVLTYPFADVIAFGAEHSSLKAPVAAAAEKMGLKLSKDPWPEQSIFTRSDHYNFVKEGVPSVYVVPGIQSEDPNIDGEAKFNEFLKEMYHKPSDESGDHILWDQAAKFAELNFNIAESIANDPQRPKWNKGNFFGETFGTELTKGL